MKVLLCNNPPININCVKNANSHYLSCPIKDSFDKSSISFMGKNPFTPDEQAEINKANKNDAPTRAKLAELKAKGLNIKDALACLNLNNPLEVEEYIGLTNNNNDLDTLDKIGLIAYEINDTERYKHLCKIGLEKYEALLATKLGLNDNEIKIYYNKRDNGTELNIQEDELMLCIKNGIYNDEQLTRFAQLKNRKRDFQNETVRKKGDEQPYPIEYIIHCIKEGKTDSDIEKEDRLIELIDEGFSIDTLAAILSLPIENYNKFKRITKDEKDVNHAIQLTKLNDEQYERYKTLKQERGDKDFALYLVSLTPEQYKRFKKLEKGEDINTKFILAPLTEEQIDKYKKLLKEGVNAFTAAGIAELNNEKFARYEKFVNNGADKETALFFVSLTDEQCERYTSLINEGRNKHIACELAYLTDVQYKRYKTIIDNGTDEYLARILATLTEKQGEKYKKLKSNGVDKNTAVGIAKLNNNEFTRYKKFVNDGEDEVTALFLASLTEEQYKRYKKLITSGTDITTSRYLASLTKEQFDTYETRIKNGIDKNTAKYIALLTDEQCKIYINMIKNGATKLYAYNIASLTDEQYSRYETILSHESNKETARSLALLTKEQYKRFETIVDRGVGKDIASYLATLNEEQYRRYLKLINGGTDEITAKTLASLTENQYIKYEAFINRGIDKDTAKYLAILTDDEYNRYKTRINNGMDKNTAMHILKLTDKQGERYIKLLKSGEDEGYAYHIAKLTDEQYERYKKIPIQISDIQAITLAKTTNLTSVTPELIEKLPEDFWYLTSMGCEKEASEIIHKAVKSMVLREENNDFVLLPLRNIEIRTPLVNYSSNYSYNQNNGDFQLTSTQPFSVNLSQGYINQKPLLVIKDKNSSNQYISYNGAIAQVKEINEHDSEQFRIWSNLSPQKQSKILSKAADEFIFNIFDEEGNCIIGQNSPKFNTKEKADSEIEQYYAQKLLELKNKNELTPQNILKLMPKNCMLTISPYIQGGNILYAIVTEWFSKNGNRWQMEIHSQDLKYNNDEKWIFRLHKTTSGGDKNYFKFAENENGYDFNGEFNGEDAHIKINTPLEENNLLNNVAFQAIITLISAKLCKDFAINKVAEKIGVTVEENNSFATMSNIVRHCMRNITDFAYNKDLIIKMRAALGKIRIV